MKIDRLLGIVTLLLQNEKVTAPYLAGKFEVSRRTISRDMEDLCKAGIPVVCEQGYGGGISIAAGYKIDKMLLTEEEKQAILIGLKGIDSIMAVPQREKVAGKLDWKENAVFSGKEHILINLASHYKEGLTEKIGLLREAACKNHLVEFDYFSGQGEMRRCVEPHLIVFQWTSWYLLGYCPQREDFRMFKLNRMGKLTQLDKTFRPRTIPEEKLEFDGCFTDAICLKALFDAQVKYRLVEEYGTDCYTETEDGRLLAEINYTNYDVLRSWILTFGSRAEVLEPECLRKDLILHAENILHLYQGT